MKKFIPSFIIALGSLWFGWTVLVDFFVVPTVFRHVDDFFAAGFLGIALFSKLNNLEVIIATALVALSSFIVNRGKSAIVVFVMSLLLLSIGLFYFSYLTPKIITLTELWKKADLMGFQGLSGIPDLQQEHQFFHRLYIGMDAVKLGFLLTLISFGIFRGEEWK